MHKVIGTICQAGRFVKGVFSDDSDMLLCFGTEMLFVGIWMVSPAASLIVLGVLFIGLAALTAKHGSTGPPV